MLINIEQGNVEILHKNIHQKLKGSFSNTSYQFHTEVNKNNVKLNIESYQFNNNFDFTTAKGDVYKPIELEINEKTNNYLRFIIVKNGSIIHTMSSSIRYRLNSSFSTITGIKGKNIQKITLPTQNDLEVFILQINTFNYAIDLNSDFFRNTKNNSLNIENEVLDFFIYQSNYGYTISETLKEITHHNKTDLTKRFYLESKTLELLWLLTEQYNREKKYGYDDDEFKKIDLETIKKAKEFIHSNFNKDITLNMLAREIGTNETKLKVGFKKIYGKTFTEILRNERLNKAKILLQENQYAIKEIAIMCGYKSTSMFTVRFKERFEVSPSEFKSS